MKNHLVSVATGLVLVGLGLLLWWGAEGVVTPVVSLSKVGLVLWVLGAVEIAVSGAALATRSTR
jgi:hypothetical protein